MNAPATQEIIRITPEKVGQIIGAKGAVIQDLQRRTGAKIYVNQNFPPGIEREVLISGTAPAMNAAIELVNQILQGGPTSIHLNTLAGGPPVSIVMECPQHLVGRVIGTSGTTIKDILARSGAKVQIDQEYPEGVPRKIHISGTQAAVNSAVQLVNYVMEHGPTLPPTEHQINSQRMQQQQVNSNGVLSFQRYSSTTPTGQQLRTLDVPRSYIGRVIGKGGETIAAIQAKSGCKVQIDQNVPELAPCKVKLTGAPQNVQMAEQLIFEILSTTMRPSVTQSMASTIPPNSLSLQQQTFQLQQMQLQQQLMAQQQQQQQSQGQPGNPFPFQQNPYSNPVMGYNLSASSPYPAPAAYSAGGPMMGAGKIGPGGLLTASPMISPSGAEPIPTVSSPWTEHKNDQGVVYWYNASTGVSQWERPAGL